MSSQSAAANTPVPAPTPGDVESTVASRPVESRSPVSLEAPAEVQPGVVVKIDSTKAVEAKASLPGEVAGPGVEYVLSVQNDTTSDIDLENVVVECADSDLAPCNRISTTPTEPFAGSVKAGGKVTATYVFILAADKRRSTTLTVTLTPDLPTVSFEGQVG